MKQAEFVSMSEGLIDKLTLTYLGYRKVEYGECFVGGGGGLYQWRWHISTENRHHVYRIEAL